MDSFKIISLFPIKEVKLKPFLKESKELKFLFPFLYRECSTPIQFKVYNMKEIFCEKIRAILTRKGIKERDFIDVYLISKKFGIGCEELEAEIVMKIKFVLNLYLKYKNNLEENLEVLSPDTFPFGSENHLLLNEINKKEFTNL